VVVPGFVEADAGGDARREREGHGGLERVVAATVEPPGVGRRVVRDEGGGVAGRLRDEGTLCDHPRQRCRIELLVFIGQQRDRALPA